MTTATASPVIRVRSALSGAAVSALFVAASVVVAGAFVDGEPAAYGALAGGLIAVLVFAGGAFAVDLVSRIMPTASLMVALTTYTLQVVVLALVFVLLNRSGALDEALSAGWLAAAVIACTLAWMLAQIVLTMRQRIPAYDLPEAGAR